MILLLLQKMLLKWESLRREKKAVPRESKEWKEKPEPSNNLYKLGLV